ncbi:MAG: DUF3574 domain-containing protein [Gracilibacteraceae bacterium]|jgi:hypothetical protein|nr:DUF3574 domain-containing protein [Gracilibacteraceae bacterium]
MERINKKQFAIIFLLIVNLAASGFLFLHVFVFGASYSENGAFDSTETARYTLYIGTNDKDTYEQIIPTETARSIVNAICAKYIGGYTVHDAKGGWFNDAGVLTEENTLVYTLIDVEESDVAAIADDVLAALNQSSVLVEKNVSRMYNYGVEQRQ